MSDSAVPRYDVVTWGETMLRLSAPRGEPLEATPALEVAVGGTESNVAIALARLGRPAAWVSRLPANPLGRRIARDIAAHGVDVSHVLWADAAEKAGLYFIEPGAAPRPNLVLYERRDSAVARLQPDALDYAFLASGRVLHLTGITPALSEGCRAAWLRSAREARAAGRRVSLDVNYRAKLWSPAAARETLEAALGHVDVLFSGLCDLTLLFGLPEDAEAAARTFAAAYGVPLVVVTLGDQGALAWEGDTERLQRAPVVPTDVQERIGAGDAFAAGFLHGWLERDVAHGLHCGNALAALKQTWRGDASWATRAELDALLADGAADARRVQR
ncbi:MAG TPA: sugar kinase [bacterium]|nr:sugar kinase [bacterium]